MLKPILILCLGNEVLSDDSFGPTLAQILNENAATAGEIEVVYAPVAGFSLLDLLQKREKVLVIDSIITGKARPGTLHFFPMGSLTPSRNLTTSHQMNLPTVLELGKQMGYEMPEHIDVLAVEVADVTTLGESMTWQVEAAVEPAIASVSSWLTTHTKEHRRVTGETSITTI